MGTSVRRRRAARLLPFATLLLAASPSRSQDAQSPVFRAGVDLVRLDVRVIGPDGVPVRDLTAAEIEVSESGQRRPVMLFQHIAESVGPTADVSRRTVASAVSTNRGAPRGHLYVLVFDQHHITAGNEQRARHAAEAFLRARVGPGDRVAVYGVPGPGPYVDFTTDTNRAIAEVAKVNGSLNRIGTGALGSMAVFEAYAIGRGDELALARVIAGYSNASTSSDLLTDVVRSSGDDPRVSRQLVREDARRIVALADEASRRFLATFADLVRALRPYEGRKTVMLFSEGFFTDHVSRELEQVAASAAESYSVVYGIDLNSRASDPRQTGPLGGSQHAEIQSRLEPLATLALETDGRLVTMANDWMDEALAGIATESADYYIVGFEPSADALRNRERYHRLKVDVKRPGAHVSTRTGYAIEPDPLLRDRRRAINIALSAPYPMQGLPVEYTTYVIPGADADSNRVVLSLAAELPLSSSRNATADVVFAVRRLNDGKVIASGTDSMSLPSAATAGAATGIGTFRVQFDLPPGDYGMRAVVREPGGLVGSADRRFTIRGPARAGVSAGDLVFQPDGGPRFPVRTIAGRDEAVAGRLELYGRSAAELERAHVTVAVLAAAASDGAAITTMRAELSDMHATATGVSRTADLRLPLAGIEPGRYVARAIVDVEGRTMVVSEREIEVAARPPRERSADSSPIDPGEIVRGELARQYVGALRARAGVADTGLFDAALQDRWDLVGRGLSERRGAAAAEIDALRGLGQLARRDLAGAIGSFSASLRANDRDARAAFFLGWAHHLAGAHRDAITSWRNAAYLDPALVPAHLALADAYVQLAQPALALQALRSGLGALPKSPELLNRLSQLERSGIRD